MPIIELPPKESPLSQGDVLRGVNLYLTADDWTAEGGGAEQLGDDTCLVLSRPCVLVNKTQVIVASVQKFTTEPPKRNDSSFDDHCIFFQFLRDGVHMPDRFYLGQLPGPSRQRYCAHFDSLHTIKLPASNELSKFLSENRLARINDDFVRSLHTRLFRSFADLGFDDYSWYETADLEMIVTIGQAELKKAEAEMHDKTSALQRSELQGSLTAGKRTGLEKEIDGARNKVREIKQKLNPYENELTGRSQAAERAIS